MGSIHCLECDELFSFDVMPRRGAICFRCHVKGVRMGFSYGKDQFHGPTLRERQAKQVSDAKINGYNIEPVGTRWV